MRITPQRHPSQDQRQAGTIDRPIAGSFLCSRSFFGILTEEGRHFVALNQQERQQMSLYKSYSRL